ncbi:MAG: RNA pseudouridine synthase [Epulopiscium sp. Nuni2H_MBin003]|nr:MAG: RNA pseudouridine synthase [Epulopiscium sp. Nuni2H_MBin003]
MDTKLVLKVEDKIEQRVDKFISNKFREYTRSFIQKQIQQGNVYVNSKVVPARFIIKYGDAIELILEEPTEIDVLAQDIPIDIVYEDEDIIIINKPKGMVVHPANGHTNDTLVNALLYHCKDSLSGINGKIRPGIVHRIDKDTTGLMMVAKNDNAHVFLSDLLKEHNIIRKYHALVYGVVKEDYVKIDKPIARHPHDRKKMAVMENGKRAITECKVIERFKNATYVELTLYTGRTHQIRVHMTSIGYPLLGDPVYGRSKHIFNLKTQQLHAKVLGFTHPSTKNEMYFENGLPEEFTKVIEKLQKI